MPARRTGIITSKGGITAIVISRGKVLLLRRRNLPFMADPGIWSFVSGGKKRGETHKESAYRELKEEVDLEKRKLELFWSQPRIVKFDTRNGKRYYNSVYIFYSSTRKARLNIENSGYRWTGIGDITRNKDYTNVFVNEKFIIQMIKRALHEERTKK